MADCPYSRAPCRYSKRHASFRSPREIPLPSPTLSEYPFPTTAPFTSPSSSKAQGAVDSTTSRQSLTRQLSAGANTPPRPPPLARLNSDYAVPAPIPTAIYPTPRPTSLPPSSSYTPPLASSSCQSPPPTPSTDIPRPPVSDSVDRYSSASLPLPYQIPFHILPKSSNTTSNMALTMTASASPPPEPSSPSTRTTDRSGIRFPSLDEISSSSSSSSSGSRDSITTTLSSLSSSDSSSTSSNKPSASSSPVTSSLNDASSSRPQPRPVSPFRAPQPPPTQPSRLQASDFNTAMRRFMTPAQPPAGADAGPSSYPPPDPPVILPAEPSDDMTQPASRSRAPYVPFLSHAPPPPDSWIEVETTHSEYKLNVRLPGFSREGITLATKRRRILHVVADSWDNGGGHFERRISFGYDADLVQVRAEFDGVMLRIAVPRRVSPIVWHSPRSGPVGRA